MTALIAGVGLLQACVAPVTTQELAVQPVLAIRHSSNLTAATQFMLGKYHQERGNFEQARTAYQTSVALDGRQLEPRNALATVLAQQGELDQAASILIQLVADFPAVPHPYNNLGYVYYLRGSYAAAASMFQNALALDAGNERVLNNLKAVQEAMAGTGDAGPDKTTTQQQEAAAARKPAPAVSEPSPVTPSVPAQARMEVLQITPNMFELQPRGGNAQLVQAAPANTAGQVTANSSRVEIANGNGVTGLAKRIRNVLNLYGIAISRLTNALPYKQRETRILYRDGFESQADALRVALNGHAVMIRAVNLPASSDIRLLLGKDVIVHMALIDGLGDASPVAMQGVAN